MEQESLQNMLQDPEMKEIVDSFLVETKEILENLDADLVSLEENPDDDLLNKIFRAFHTIKGTSGFLGLDKTTSVTHRCEDILNKLRKGEVNINSDIIDAILDSYDTIKELVRQIEKDKNEEVETDETIEKLNNLIKDLESGNVPGKKETKKRQKEKTTKAKKKSTGKKKETEEKPSSPKKDTIKSYINKKDEDTSIRVDVKRLDDLLNLVSELVLGRNQLAQVNTEMSIEYEGTKIARDLSNAVKQVDLMTNELQLVVMKTRMVKIGKVFNKFPRLVRDLSRDLGKQVKLNIYGEETELDKTLIEEINDPLVHLIRNSMDHGIESPEDRKKNKKPVEGTINLNAEHEGNNIHITIEDDGKGIDPEVIKERAVSKGLISREKAKELSTQEIYNLIFLPGFSTASQVTNVSGRGVGMDVVRTNVMKLRGIIDVESEIDKGTKIVIKLPLTLAIIQGLVVSVDSEYMVIPLNSVIEVIREHVDNIKTVNGNETLKVRDKVIPLVSIQDLLYRNHHEEKDKVWQYVVLVGIAEKKFGIKVDELIGQKEVVIKSLGKYLGDIKGIAGSTIMGDGKVVMILDISELIHKLG